MTNPTDKKVFFLQSNSLNDNIVFSFSVQLLCLLLVVSSAIQFSLAVYDALTSDAILYPVKYTTPLVKFVTYVSCLALWRKQEKNAF